MGEVLQIGKVKWVSWAAEGKPNHDWTSLPKPTTSPAVLYANWIFSEDVHPPTTKWDLKRRRPPNLSATYLQEVSSGDRNGHYCLPN